MKTRIDSAKKLPDSSELESGSFGLSFLRRQESI